MRQHGNGLLQKQRILIKIIEMVDSSLPLSTENPLWSSFELDLKIKKRQLISELPLPGTRLELAHPYEL